MVKILFGLGVKLGTIKLLLNPLFNQGVQMLRIPLKHKVKNLYKLGSLVVLVVVAIAGVAFIWSGLTYTKPVKLYLTPPIQTINKGYGFAVQVRLANPNKVSLHRVDAYLNFPAKTLAVSSVSGRPSYYSTQVAESFDNAQGTVKIIRTNAPSAASAPDTLVATINFVGKDAGSATANFNLTLSAASQQSAKGAKNKAANQLTGAEGGSFTVNDIVLSRSGSSQGIKLTLTPTTTQAELTTALAAQAASKAPPKPKPAPPVATSTPSADPAIAQAGHVSNSKLAAGIGLLVLAAAGAYARKRFKP